MPELGDELRLLADQGAQQAQPIPPAEVMRCGDRRRRRRVMRDGFAAVAVAGAVAALLAIHRHGFSPGLLVLAFVGLILAHVANNLMNDLFDVEVAPRDRSRVTRCSKQKNRAVARFELAPGVGLEPTTR